jgi:hypothetical protein
MNSKRQYSSDISSSLDHSNLPSKRVKPNVVDKVISCSSLAYLDKDLIKRIALFQTDIAQIMYRMTLVCRHWNRSILEFTSTSAPFLTSEERKRNSWQFWRTTYNRYFTILECEDEHLFKEQLEKFLHEIDEAIAQNILKAVSFETRLFQLRECKNWKEAFIVRYKALNNSTNYDRRLADLVWSLCHKEKNCEPLLENWSLIREKFHNLELIYQYRSLYVPMIDYLNPMDLSLHDSCLYYSFKDGIAITSGKHKMSDEIGTSGESRFEYRLFSRFIPSEFEVILIEREENFVVGFELLVNNELIAKQEASGNNEILIFKRALIELFCKFVMDNTCEQLTADPDQQKNIWGESEKISPMLLHFFQCLIYPPQMVFVKQELFPEIDNDINKLRISTKKLRYALNT